MTIRLSNETTESEFRVGAANLTGSDSQFNPGERFKREYGLTGKYSGYFVFVQRPDSRRVTWG